MRLLTIVPLTLLLTAGTAAAQDRQFGIKGGPSFSTLEFEGNEGYDARTAGTYGVFGVLPISGGLALQLEALFVPKGGESDLGNDVTATLVIDYLDFPVLLRVAPRRSGRYGPYVFGGPYVGVRTNAKAKLTFRGPGGTGGESEDVGDAVERFDAGALAGAGVDIGRRFLVEARYGWGLRNASADPEDGELKHRFFSVMAGFRF